MFRPMTTLGPWECQRFRQSQFQPHVLKVFVQSLVSQNLIHKDPT